MTALLRRIVALVLAGLLTLAAAGCAEESTVPGDTGDEPAGDTGGY